MKRPALSLEARLARVAILARNLDRTQRHLEQHLRELGVTDDEIGRMDVRLRVADVPGGNAAIARQILQNTYTIEDRRSPS